MATKPVPRSRCQFSGCDELMGSYTDKNTGEVKIPRYCQYHYEMIKYEETCSCGELKDMRPDGTFFTLCRKCAGITQQQVPKTRCQFAGCTKTLAPFTDKFTGEVKTPKFCREHHIQIKFEGKCQCGRQKSKNSQGEFYTMCQVCMKQRTQERKEESMKKRREGIYVPCCDCHSVETISSNGRCFSCFYDFMKEVKHVIVHIEDYPEDYPRGDPGSP